MTTAQYKTLIVPTHPGVQYHFCRVGLPTYFLGNWDQFQYWRPQLPNVHNLVDEFEDAQAEWGHILGRDDFTVVSFYPNTVAWVKEKFGVDLPYIPLGLDTAEYGGWT